MIDSHIIVKGLIMEPKNVFILMPFSKTSDLHSEGYWDDVYENVFRRTFEEYGYECSRSCVERGNLIKTIIEKIFKATIVIADITDRNSNVFYELGIRHSLKNGTIIVSQNMNDIPSDLRNYWCIEYGIDAKKLNAFKDNAKRICENITKDLYMSDNPVKEYLDGINNNMNYYGNITIVRKIESLQIELSATDNLLQAKDILNVKNEISTICLDNLIVERYIEIDDDEFIEILKLARFLKQIRRSVKIDTKIFGAAKLCLHNVSGSINNIHETIITGNYNEKMMDHRIRWIKCKDKDMFSEPVRIKLE
jgi:hypothetical protein